MPTKDTITTTTVGNSTPGVMRPQRIGPIVKPGVRKPVRNLIAGKKPKK